MRIINWIINIAYEERIILLSRITMIFNYLWSVVKIATGFFTDSHFVIINGLFTLIIGLTKHLCIWGLQKESSKTIRRVYLIVCSLLFISNIFYIVYMTRLFNNPHEGYFTEIISIAIATFSFTSLTMSIIGLIKTKNKHPLLNLVKVISFMIALTDIALTQIALLSISSTVIVDHYNALFGIGIGVVGVVISIYMFIKIWKNKEFKVKKELKEAVKIE